MDWNFPFHDSPLNVFLGIRPRMPAGDIYVFDNHPVPIWEHPENAPGLPTVFPGQNFDLIILLNV
jgi:hypothetical protein